jgi:predicted DNA-binding transcriptional regulator YafY
MSEVVRLYQYKSLLSGRRAVSAEDLMARLEISRATLKRDIAKLRDQLHVPIEFDRDAGGYTLSQGHTDSELPGLWFSQDELLALVTIQQLLEQLEPGLLGPKLKPLKDRLGQLMTKHGLSSQDVARRIRIMHAGKRVVPAKSFEVVAAATLARKRLKISHFSRQNGQTTEREVSPQRLVHYRDNWYLDAWCHLRDDLRSFSIDAIPQLEILGSAAKEVSDKTIEETVGAGYGIFNGAPKAWAMLKFTPERARWVDKETWHPQQEAHTEPGGSLMLTFPYSDDRELVGDILRFGADVEVVGPAGLRSKVQRQFLAAAARYV